jgi:putative transposase
MLRWSKLILDSVLRLCWSRRDLLVENLVLRQQLAVLKRRRRRLCLRLPDKLFWVLVRRLWSGWREALAIVTPETVVRWHRAGFKLYWAWISRRRGNGGRRPTDRELRELIFQMVAENPTWGAPRIHGELQMLGFDVSERTVSRWVRLAPRNPEPAKRWLAFLHNHRELITAMDFFTVPTITFGVLYCFFIIAHDRRRILHFNVTRNPTGAWVVQQLREAFPYRSPHRHLIFDRDAKFGFDVVAAVKAMGSEPVRTSFRSPWQNGVAERWIGSCRRDLLDHVIVRDARHLKRLLSEYVRYYHQDRTHLGLNKGTPAGRAAVRRRHTEQFVYRPRLGGLHHRYDLAA